MRTHIIIFLGALLAIVLPGYVYQIYCDNTTSEIIRIDNVCLYCSKKNSVFKRCNAENLSNIAVSSRCDSCKIEFSHHEHLNYKESEVGSSPFTQKVHVYTYKSY
jgi:hypothetical protein